MRGSSEAIRGRRNFSLPSSSRRIAVEYCVPSQGVRTSYILFVLHGVLRDPKTYLEPWVPIVEATGCAVFAPHFTREDYPGSSSYNQGNVLTPDGQVRSREAWSFQAIEDLFDEVKAWLGSTASSYAMYGHSAGAQFVHRMLLLCPDLRASIAIAANAGWYTLPTFEQSYPHGLSGLDMVESQAKQALESNLILLLGEEDAEIDDPNLRKSFRAMEQGVHRLERGLNFYEAAVSAAAILRTRLGWRKQLVPGVGHDHSAMAAHASSILMEHFS